MKLRSQFPFYNNATELVMGALKDSQLGTTQVCFDCQGLEGERYELVTFHSSVVSLAK